MRSGRPAYHVKAHYISFFNIVDRSMVYFELDSKGNLKKKENGQFSSHFENAYTVNNPMAMNPKEALVAPNSDVSITNKVEPNQEIDKNIEEPPSNIIEENVMSDYMLELNESPDIFDSINDTDFYFTDYNFFNFSEDQTLDIT